MRLLARNLKANSKETRYFAKLEVHASSKMPFGLFRGFGGGGNDGGISLKSESSTLADAPVSAQDMDPANRRNLVDYYKSCETDNDSSFDGTEMPHQKATRRFSISTDTFRLPKSLLSGFSPTMTALPEHSLIDDDNRVQTNKMAHAATTSAASNETSSLSQSIFSSMFGGGPGRLRRRAMSVDSGVGNSGATTPYAADSQSSELSTLNNGSPAADAQSPLLADDVFCKASKFAPNDNAAESMQLTTPENNNLNPLQQSMFCDRQSSPILVSFVQY